MIHKSAIFGVFLLSMTVGCASTGDMDTKVKQLRDEIYAEIKLRNEYVRDGLQKELKDIKNENKRNIEDSANKVQNEITQIKEIQKKYAVDTDKTLIDHQKQILQNKMILEDTARRVYLLESIVAAKAPVVSQIREGYVTFVDSNKISISLGSVNEVKVGDYFGIYKDTEKIGSIRIDTVEMNSSKGVIVNLNKDKAITIGDKIEIEKGNTNY